MEVGTSMCSLVIHHFLVVWGRLRVDHDKQEVFGLYLQPLLPNCLLYFAQDIPPTACAWGAADGAL